MYEVSDKQALDFEELFQQVVDLLKAERRVSYRALKKRFAISDDDLEAIRDELIEAKRLAVDENDKVIVWTAGRPEDDDDVDESVDALAAGVVAPEAERRQLTVVFFDIVGSTELAGQLDPEDWREVLKDYQRCVSEVVEWFDGHVAQYLGDGILAYFGFPRAHEDDARRAVRAGLEVVQAIETLNERLRASRGLSLRVRIGVHTGPVVVGDVGSGSRHEQLALGETPNLAARLQGVAEPNTILISGDTHRLLEEQFHYESLGVHQLRGIADPVSIYRVLADSGIRSRFDNAATGLILPMVGRETELAWLARHWEQVANGTGQSVLITGEHGVGKSRLVQAFKEYVSSHSGRWGVMRGSPYFHHTPLYPLIDIWREAMEWRTDDSNAQKLLKLEASLSQSEVPLEESVPLFASLLHLELPEGRYPVLKLSAEMQKSRTLELLAGMVMEFGRNRPFMLVVEDLQLIDPTTADLLRMLVERVGSRRLLLLFTCQPSVTMNCISHDKVSVLSLERLEAREVAELVLAVTGGKPLPDELVERIVDSTDGVPAAVEEVTKMLLESDLLEDQGERYALRGQIDEIGIPATLQDSLMARLDQLATAKPVAQLCATIGRKFNFEIVAAVSALDRDHLIMELDRLVRAGVLAQRGEPPAATYNFRHAMLQQAAYESLLRSTRREYHRQIATTLRKRFPETPPEVLAYHFTAAGRRTRAIEYWRAAGKAAIQQSANEEAVAHLQNGLELVPKLRDVGKRTARELDLRTHLGPALIAMKGWAAPEVALNYTRARELAQHLEDTKSAPMVLTGLSAYHIVRADYRTASEIVEELFELVRREGSVEAEIAAEAVLGCILMNQGNPAAAIEHFEKGMPDPLPEEGAWLSYHYGQHPRVFCLAMAARAMWLLGYPDQALDKANAAVEAARKIAHPLSEAFALEWIGGLHLSRREPDRTSHYVDEALELSTEQGFPMYKAVATAMRGAILVEDGHADQGLGTIMKGLEDFQATGAMASLTYYLSILAESFAALDRVDEALAALERAFSIAGVTGESWWLAELFRLKGEFLKNKGSSSEDVESCFQEALGVARRQGARSLELRAALSLGTLWLEQGRGNDALDLVGPIYDSFDEGLATGDLVRASNLVKTLRAA